MSHPRPPVVVVGVGSPMRGDDALGPHVVELLSGPLSSRPDVELVTLDGEPVRLVEVVDGRELAVLIDAVATGAEPGTIHRLEPAGLQLGVPTRVPSTHGAGVAEAMRLGAVLDRLPARMVVLGVEPDGFELGAPLGEKVEAAVSALVAQVVKEVTR